MRIISVNVGTPQDISWKGKTVSTAIFKSPVEGRAMLRRLNLDGDRQADLSVHGGANKAIYLYPAEHYPYWRSQYSDLTLDWGMFGENLTVEGLAESDLHIGDRLRIGEVELLVTQPRIPCYKLGIRFGRDDILKRFLESLYSGWYAAVLHEGHVGAGDPIIWTERDDSAVTVTDIVRLYAFDKSNLDLLQRAIATPALPESWRDYFEERLARIE